MSAATKKPILEQQPWDTKSFHQTRLCIVLVYFVWTAAHHPKWTSVAVILFYGVAMAVLAIDGIHRWHQGKAAKVTPRTDGSEQARKQYVSLLWGMTQIILMFLAAVICVALEGRELAHNLFWGIRLFVELALLNLGGWYMIRWLGEALPLVRLYRKANQLVTVEPEPMTISSTTDTPVATATAQPAPITVQIGSGQTP